MLPAVMHRAGDEPRYPLGVVVFVCESCRSITETSRNACGCGGNVRPTMVFNGQRGLGRGR